MEFFAGEANVFAKVKSIYPGTAVDFEYLKERKGPGRSNAFDILGESGMAFLDYIGYSILGHGKLCCHLNNCESNSSKDGGICFSIDGPKQVP